MGVQRLGRDTTSVDALAWSGDGFGNATADAMWAELSIQLKHIAIAEIMTGNAPINILRNDTRSIVLLSFQLPPLTPRPDVRVVKVHSSFAAGNYCYDGTHCTYEDLESGDFLAFGEPEYADAL